jgi:hypothetical protein
VREHVQWALEQQTQGANRRSGNITVDLTVNLTAE